jgi:hypothetical protein
MIFPTEEFDITIITPVGIPAVSNKPVWNTFLDAPSKNSDAVTTDCFSMNVLVNA